MRERISLNGIWDWAIPGGPPEQKIVPSSYRCVGEATYNRTFDTLLLSGRRLFLCFAGITYEGSVRVNGHDVGQMGPFTPYEFDITLYVVPGANRLEVNVKDILAGYGPLIGWESYAGLIREVYLEVRSASYIADYHWQTDLRDGYRLAHCTLDVAIESACTAGEGVLEGVLAYHGQVVQNIHNAISLVPGSNTIHLACDVAEPRLWSPEEPNLYTLNLSLTCDAENVDALSREVGIKEFVVCGDKFKLNGQEVILHGVCRHDMWGEDQGHTLSHEQIEQDLRLIKELGANYVRLVHYPHDEYVVETADRLGLMVSGEPMSWASDFSDVRVAVGTLECLRRLILRDRNKVSVIFWLCWNECQFKGSYLREAHDLCRALDPTRPVSAANHQVPAATKLEFDRVGMDFYTFHPYGIWPDRVHAGFTIEQVLQLMPDKPVVFTEWGGWPVQGNYLTMDEFGRTFVRFARQHVPQPSLAGFAFWEWADMPEPVREPPACHNGLLNEGLVDVNRSKRPMYVAMASLFENLKVPAEAPWPAQVSECSIAVDPQAVYIPLDMSSQYAQPAQAEIWELARQRMLEERRPLINQVVGPLLPKAISTIGQLPVALAAGRPLLLAEGAPMLEIKVGCPVSGVIFLGQVSLVKGYPLGGEYGATVARYMLCYDDNSQQEVLLHNGQEIAAASTIYLHSRINPLASRAPRALHIRMDSDWKEAYQVNYLIVPAQADRVLAAIRFELLDSAYIPALYGVTLAL